MAQTQAPTIREEMTSKVQETLNTLTPILVDLIFEDFFTNRTEDEIAADSALLAKFNETYKVLIGSDSGFDFQLAKIREIKGANYVNGVDPFRKPRNKSDDSSDAAKAAKVKF